MNFDKIKGKLGFGCMRLKMTNDKVDYQEFNRMIDAFIASGFNYFDTAHGYIDGKSETAIRDCLVARYNREDYVLADKLSDWFFEKEEDIIPLFEKQLEICGVEYFDIYLFHCLTRNSYPKHKRCNSFEIAKRLKEQGKIKHIAMSFHDTADILDMILSEQPDIEAVQLQINYLDYDDPAVQSQKCYEVAVKHGKKVIVMEPVKGGKLANVPEKVETIFKEVHPDWSPASWAIRFTAGLDGVISVLSGMSNMDQLKDNMSYMKEFEPLGERELNLLKTAAGIINNKDSIPCTSCRYCVAGCPVDIPIPEYFTAYNKKLAGDSDYKEYFHSSTDKKGTAQMCIKCKKCEQSCPQHIEIAKKLENLTDLI